MSRTFFRICKIFLKAIFGVDRDRLLWQDMFKARGGTHHKKRQP